MRTDHQLLEQLLELHEPWEIRAVRTDIHGRRCEVEVGLAAPRTWFGLVRKLPPETSAMGIMAVPLIGTLSAAFIMGERPHWQDYVAIAFVMAAMAAVLYPPRAASGSPPRP